MDHQYIDQHDIAGRYLRKELPTPDRDTFQSHMVDCPECADRVLLAEMFEGDPNAPAKPRPALETPVPAFLSTQPKLPLRARIVAYLSPLQLVVLLMIFVMVLLGIPALIYLWELQNR